MSNSNTNSDTSRKNRPGLLSRITTFAIRRWQYYSEGVWTDTRRTWSVRLIKTLNLSVRSFLDRDLQSQAAAMTFKTLLAIVPALALIFAFGKGFGLQNLLQNQLAHFFPVQTDALNKTFSFVDSYLATSSEGLFVGVGIIFLLYTLISLLSSVENSFNIIWGIKRGRSLGRMITDYTAILLILPVLLLCSSGITVFMSSLLQTALPFKELTPLISAIVDFIGIALGWLFFAGTYTLIPNTHVKFKNALIAGILAGTAYIFLQWLFVTGQIYVTRYNAIYGSFAFLPLLLLWLQLVWLITLAGGVLCYASQSIYEFSFSNEIAKISINYRFRIILSVLLITIKRREQGLKPIDEGTLSSTYGLPISLVTKAVNDLVDVGLMERVIVTGDIESPLRGVAPALDTNTITLGLVIDRLTGTGSTDFIPGFEQRFKSIIDAVNDIDAKTIATANQTLLRDLTLEA